MTAAARTPTPSRTSASFSAEADALLDRLCERVAAGETITADSAATASAAVSPARSSGCSGAATQKLCYAAQQCAIARCVGSTVHMHRPACMLGISLRDRAESVLAVTQAAWLVAYELLRLIVDASTGTVEAEVAVSFPFDALDIVVCDMKVHCYLLVVL